MKAAAGVDGAGTLATGFIARYGLVRYRPNLARKYPRAGLCEICGRPPAGKPILLFDHCHRHQWVRGLICNWCNDQIGFIENGLADRRQVNTALLASFAVYLRNCPGCRTEGSCAPMMSDDDYDDPVDRCAGCGSEVDHYLGCPEDPSPDYEAEAQAQRDLLDKSGSPVSGKLTKVSGALFPSNAAELLAAISADADTGSSPPYTHTLKSAIHRHAWDCEAYGRDGREIGALCFFGERGERICGSVELCHENMTRERQRVFDRIQEKASAGEPDFVYLAGEFTSPDQLLNSSEDSQS